MNWTWNLRSGDGGMNGLEFSRCTTAGGFSRVLVHAAPGQLQLEVIADDGSVVCRGDLDRAGDYSPITMIELGGGEPRRSEVWPDESCYGLPVLIAGGEVGILHKWEHADDRSWWRWAVEFSNHTGRPADWSPEGQHLQR